MLVWNKSKLSPKQGKMLMVSQSRLTSNVGTLNSNTTVSEASFNRASSTSKEASIVKKSIYILAKSTHKKASINNTSLLESNNRQGNSQPSTRQQPAPRKRINRQ